MVGVVRCNAHSNLNISMVDRASGTLMKKTKKFTLQFISMIILMAIILFALFMVGIVWVSDSPKDHELRDKLWHSIDADKNKE